MKLIGCDAIDHENSDSIWETPGSCELYVPGAEPQEPIRVRVRIRWYADTPLEIRRIRTDTPDLSRLPVGAILDCYV